MGRLTIGELPPAQAPSSDHEVPVEKNGITEKLSIGLLLSLLSGDAPEDLDTLEKIASVLIDHIDDDDNPHEVTAAQVGTLSTEEIATALALRVSVEAQSLSSAQKAQARSNMGITLQGFIYGLLLSNNSGDPANRIDIAAGVAADNAGSAALMVLGAVLTKRLDAPWAVGSGNGGLDTGSIANTTYHVWLIQRPDTGVVDALFSTSATAPTMPAGYDRKRRIGSIIRAGGTILAFSQSGDEFLLDAPVLDVDVNNQGTSTAFRTLTVPAGIVVTAKMRVYAANLSVAWGLLVSSPAVSPSAPSTTASPLVTLYAAANNGDIATVDVRTNSSAAIRTQATTASTILRIATYGWIDNRGRSA